MLCLVMFLVGNTGFIGLSVSLGEEGGKRFGLWGAGGGDGLWGRVWVWGDGGLGVGVEMGGVGLS